MVPITEYSNLLAIALNNKRIQLITFIRRCGQSPIGAINLGRQHHCTFLIELMDIFRFPNLFNKLHIAMFHFDRCTSDIPGAVFNFIRPTSKQLDFGSSAQVRIRRIEDIQQAIAQVRPSRARFRLSAPTGKATVRIIDHRRQRYRLTVSRTIFDIRLPVASIEHRINGSHIKH